MQPHHRNLLSTHLQVKHGDVVSPNGYDAMALNGAANPPNGIGDANGMLCIATETNNSSRKAPHSLAA